MQLLSAVLKVRRRKVLGYAVAVLLSFLALWVRLQLSSIFEGFPFLTFFLVVLASAFIGGLGPGLACAIASGLLAQYMLIDPAYSLEVSWPSGWIALAVYGLTAAIMVGLVHGLTLAYEGQWKTQRQLAELNQTLEERVAKRTEELKAQIEERTAAEGQMRQMQKMEVVGQLTGGIAHDFNNMLNIVVGALDLAQIRAEAQDDDRIVKYIGVAQEGAQKAARLTARLMAFARQQPLAPQAIDVNQLVGGLSEMLQRTLGDHIEVKFVLSGRVWHCFADPSQLENALMNLCINARDAMPEGGALTIETSNIEVEAGNSGALEELQPGQYVRLSVRDTGTGMPPEVVQKALEPFFTTKGVGRGTGLGLSQVFGYVKQSGGSLAIASKQKVGTTVEITLPRFAGQAQILASIGEQISPILGSASETILLVEDEEQVRSISADALQGLGYTVIAVADPEQALEMIKQQPEIDLLLTDVMMPVMSGRSLAEKACALRPDLKVLYMTGFAPDPEGDWKPGSALLLKPFTVERLARAVRQSISSYRVN